MQSNATSNNPCTGFSNNDSPTATTAAACTTVTTSTSLSTAAWRAACAVAVLSFFIGVLVHRGAVLS